ncbi:hypothetical protein IT774_04960 [Salinimonas marina]|uniref:Uncharacterized protein n=1 Tax=Salinimonas marina TaxID=2785918 RepID=A0A7S9DZ23_9ALTE|nr:hypothetical protein [Salinimonas marina]QPG06525.1 hypothetical protein IT774_04960 [Salinimonas marina]
MIGWKVLSEVDGKEVVCEVIGQAVADETGFGIPLYYNGHIMMVWYEDNEKIKVIDRN